MTFISGKLILESLISDDLTQNTSPNDLFSLVNYKISVLAFNIASKIADILKWKLVVIRLPGPTDPTPIWWFDSYLVVSPLNQYTYFTYQMELIFHLCFTCLDDGIKKKRVWGIKPYIIFWIKLIFKILKTS